MLRLKMVLGVLGASTVAVVMALGSSGAGADTGGAAPNPRLPDGVPAGVTIPEGAGSQAFEFGNCQSRQHVTGSWVCMDSGDATTARTSRRMHRRRSHHVRAHAAAYYHYSFSDPQFAYWGYGGVQYGQIWWERAGNFNGSQSQFWQAADITDGAHTARYDFRLEVYRKTSLGWEYRDVQRDIVPDYPNCTRDRARQPTWYHAQAKGYDYHQDIWFKIRDCAVSNPDTADGTWYSIRYSTKTYHCVDSTGNCYFKGY